MSEQRLRARLAALETAHMVHGFVADGHVGPMLGIAEAFEDWLMRAEPIDTTGLNVALQQPCGAYLRPDWFVGAHWFTCTGEHVTEAQADAWGSSSEVVGWHLTDGYTRFATHHAVNDVNQRCACGNGWPCAETLR